MYTIKEVADKMEVSEHTLRFWAKSGFFPFLQRDNNNIRRFSENAEAGDHYTGRDIIKTMVNILNDLKLNGNILLVVESLNENIVLATRNLPNVILLEASEINTYDVISADVMVVTSEAIKQIEEVLV